MSSQMPEQGQGTPEAGLDRAALDERTRAGAGGEHDSSHIIPQPGAIEGYHLQQELHRGGQGVVYRAIQLGTRRVVALKVLLEGPFAAASTRRRFEREIELAASLRHPNIVTILDSGLSQGRYFFAMEFIDGQRLDRYLAQRRPPLPEVLRLFEKVCLAVNFAHQRGVIHRDLKPPNILVDDAGEPHILDFGLAKPIHALAPTESTVQILSLSGQLLGTVAYMSPEQSTGMQDVDVRSDVYSLGVVFYEALVGLPPYSVDGSLAEILARIVGDDPMNPLNVRSPIGVRIDDELATILLKSLEKEPHRRYQTAGEFAADLRRRMQGEPIQAKHASGLYMLRKFLKRYRTPVLAAGTLLTLLVTFLVVFAALFTREREARRRVDLQMEETQRAVQARDVALAEAGERTAEALRAQHQLRRALSREHIQRGNLAQERGDLAQARDSYWRAMESGPGVAATWALRRYYQQTPEVVAACLSLAGGPRSVLSADGRWAALAGPEGGITVRALEGQAEDWWIRAPNQPNAGPARADRTAESEPGTGGAGGQSWAIDALNIDASGAVAAVSANWLRTWTYGSIEPTLAARVPRDADGRPAVFVVDGGRGAVLVFERSVTLLQSHPEEPVTGNGIGQPENGIQETSVTLRGNVSGEPDCDLQARRVCIPTNSGVEVVRWAPAEGLTYAGLWPVMPKARAVRFLGPEDVAILPEGDGVVALLDLRSRGTWRVTSLVPSTQDAYFLVRAGERYAVAAQNGRLGLFEADRWLWQVPHLAERLRGLRWSAGSSTLVALDGNGVLTHWNVQDMAGDKPAGRARSDRLLTPGPAMQWAGAADGSTALLALPRQYVMVYSPARSPEPRTLLRPRAILPIGEDNISLAVSDDGRRVLIREHLTLHFIDLSDFQQESVERFTWRDGTLPVTERIALSGDGELAALLIRSSTGDRQQTELLPWRGAGARGTPAAKPPPIEFVGAAVRQIAFFPGSHDLLVARSNGQLYRYPIPTARGAAQPTPAPVLFHASESVPKLLAFSRRGDYLALSGEDQVLRIIATASREVRCRVSNSAEVSALSFSPHDDVLLVRTVDGSVRLVDPATGETVASWVAGPSQRPSLGLWIGPAGDSMLLSTERGVQEIHFADADQAIARNRPYAAELSIASAVAEGDTERAWRAAANLRELSPERARNAAVALVESSWLRGMSHQMPDWVENLLADASPSTCLRLGHAAYAGERFAEARAWLGRGAAAVNYEVDALTRWRLAGCDYLAGEYDRAADQLALLIHQPDFDPALQPIADLQRVAALVLGGRREEGQRVAQEITQREQSMRALDPVAATYASVLARVIAGIEPENAIASVFNKLIVLPGALLYREDEFFFAGELTRRRGDLSLAAAHYQRCIDLAQDDWPASWARVRLLELSRSAPAAPAGARRQAQPTEVVQ